MSERDEQTGRFQVGASGNPAGRPRGSGKVAALRERISENIDDVLAVVHKAALEGDISAARLLVDRCIPVVKPVGYAQSLDLQVGNLTQQAQRVLALVASGELAIGEASELLGAIGTVSAIIERDQFAARLAALECRHNSNGDSK